VRQIEARYDLSSFAWTPEEDPELDLPDVTRQDEAEEEDAEEVGKQCFFYTRAFFDARY
jgi:hypothetical protein